MESVVLVIHMFLALAIIGLVLIQRSEGGGLGIGGGGGLGGLSTPKGTADALTRATAICAAGFFATSLILGILAGTHSPASKSILDALEQDSPAIEQVIDETSEGTENTEPPSAPIAN